jgi:hypothetical protein
VQRAWAGSLSHFLFVLALPKPKRQQPALNQPPSTTNQIPNQIPQRKQVKEDTFRTKSGRDVALRIYTQPQYIDEVGFAMTSLKKSMKWDEDVYGLEYDLDLFNIVAVDDFNMGAMENKSLNIFNSRLVLATPESSTDGDYARIEGVVGHEYFHNWTGNRVTCRDWFQLTLKEGLTVFRDQEFSSDMNSRCGLCVCCGCWWCVPCCGCLSCCVCGLVV